VRPRKCCPRVDPKFYWPETKKLVHDIHPHPTNYGSLDKDQVRYSIKNYDSSNKERKCEDQNKNVILNLCRLSHDFLL
jgi:hypothetical protein